MNENKNVLRLTPEDSKLFVEECMADTAPNDVMLRAAEKYAKTQEVISKRIDKEWLDSLQTENDVLNACVELCRNDYK